jgi:hypothetical protein
MTSTFFFVEPSWVLQRRESHRDSTSRPWSFGDVEFPLEARVTLVGLSIESAVGLLLNLETAGQGRSVLLSDEQNLLLTETKKGFVENTKTDFMRR